MGVYTPFGSANHDGFEIEIVSTLQRDKRTRRCQNMFFQGFLQKNKKTP